MYRIKTQNGVVLLVLMLVMLSATAFYYSKTLLHRSHDKQEDLYALVAAKEALLAYAVNYADNYGHNSRGGVGRLPCPALDRFSSPARSCGVANIGFLPSVWLRSQKAMEIDYLERFLDRDIRYAVAADHRYNPSFNSLNSLAGNGLLSVDSDNQVVAVLIAPGEPTDGQSRQAGARVLGDYLEGENADSDNVYTLSESNDLVMPIRRSELLPLMERRVLGFVKQWLKEYKQTHGYYPYASRLGGVCVQGLRYGFLSTDAGDCAEQALAEEDFTNLPARRVLRQSWFYRYEWYKSIMYVVDENCTAAAPAESCDGIDDPERSLSFNGNPVSVVLISTSEPIVT